MFKVGFPRLLLIVAMLSALDFSRGALAQDLFGATPPTQDSSTFSALRPLTWLAKSDEQVALTGYFDDGGCTSGCTGGCTGGCDGGCTAGCDCCTPCCCGAGIGNWFDNTETWFGFDTYKSLGDQSPVALPHPSTWAAAWAW